MGSLGKSISISVLSILFGLGTAPTSGAQTISATGQLSDAASGGSFNYTLTLQSSAGSTTNIETFWFSWVPGEDFMDVNPSNVGTPPGWTGNITHGGSSDGYAIQFVTSTAGLAPGGSLTFTFTSTSSPATMGGDSAFYSSTPMGTSFIYSGAPFSAISEQFVVQTVPEPSTLVLLAASLVGLAAIGWRRIVPATCRKE